jgi:hypothetical protein
MGYQLQADDLGVTAYQVLESATIQVRMAHDAMGNVTAAQPLSLLEIIMPPLAFLKAGGQAAADMKTAAGRNAAAQRLADLELALGNACEQAAAADQGPIGERAAAQFNALLAQAEDAGATVTRELQRAQAAAAPTNTIAEAPGTALEAVGVGGAAAVRGVGQGVGAAVGAVGWVGRNLLWLILGAVGVGVGLLFVFKLPQRWIARRRKG